MMVTDDRYDPIPQQGREAWARYFVEAGADAFDNAEVLSCLDSTQLQAEDAAARGFKLYFQALEVTQFDPAAWRGYQRVSLIMLQGLFFEGICFSQQTIAQHNIDGIKGRMLKNII